MDTQGFEKMCFLKHFWKNGPGKMTPMRFGKCVLGNIFGKWHPEKTTPRTPIFGSASKFRADIWRRYLNWSRKRPNQAILENPDLANLWPGRPGQPSTRPPVNQATHQAGLGGGVAGP